ncbi:hypothetical protein [Caulobacter phage Cr30]|uniref:hypothetical protein n=1 Tax=Caulobacter phage Cr30 TaxID=1357714 RepID=UPI0004A9B3DD|nr:hypothetical protein OZ74_gp081 [Caulobacter phage Cr30]AGS80966.1 hypothetical protein [Caulobacter phage Cr30]
MPMIKCFVAVLLGFGLVGCYVPPTENNPPHFNAAIVKKCTQEERYTYPRYIVKEGEQYYIRALSAYDAQPAQDIPILKEAIDQVCK